MGKLGVRVALLWLGIAVGAVLALLAALALPGASVWPLQNDGGQVIDLTDPDVASSPPGAEKGDGKPTKPEQPTARPTPKPREDGLAVRPEPIVILNSRLVTHNSEVVARGYGFEPYEDILISVYSPYGELEGEIGWIRTDEEGNFTDAKLAIPYEYAPGEHLIVAIGQNSGATGQASVRVQASGPWLALNSYAEKPYAYYTFRAGGFDPGEEIALYFDSVSSAPIGTVRADELGGLLEASARVPLLGAGEHAFILVGQESKTVVSSPFTVLDVHPWVGLSSYSPQPEQRIGFNGHDFVPGEKVSFFINSLSGAPVGTVTADENGNFETQDNFEVPVNAMDEIVLIFFGSASQVPVEVTLEVLPFSPLLELSTYAGPPGTKVSFTGQGFARNEVIHVYAGKAGGREVTSFATDQYGKFSEAGEFSIPFDLGGSGITLTAVGENSRVPVALEFALMEVVPWVELSQYDGPTGAIITFGGRGFGLEEMVTIYAGDDRSSPIATAAADGSGAFAEAGPYVIPEDAKGEIRFTAVGEQSKASATATFTVASYPSAPEDGPAGEETPPPPSPSP